MKKQPNRLAAISLFLLCKANQIQINYKDQIIDSKAKQIKFNKL